jgi:Leucine-rich repeat (LRR) protein
LELSEYSLKKLDLSGCGLTKLPGSLELYRKLEELNLSNNPRIHSDISFLKIPKCRLKKLDLSGCGLTKLPEGFKFYHVLEELNLSNNPLSHSDISFLELSSLKKLDLSGCDLIKLPNDLEEWSNLQELNFSNNSFDHQDLLEKLNSGKVFSYLGFHQSGKELLEPTASGLGLSKLTRIIFEDAVYTQSGGG